MSAKSRIKPWVAVCAIVVSLAASSAHAVTEGEAAPDFTLPSLTGGNLRLEEYRGKVVLVNFWASWCGPCRQEMPILDQIHKRYGSLGFAVLGVNVEAERSKARQVAERTGVSFPLVFDEAQTVSEAWAIESMPYSVLIDRSGKVRYIHKGYKPGDERQYVDALKAVLRSSR